MEKHFEDYWNVDGDCELSDTWIGCTRFTKLNEKTTGWIYMIRGKTDEKTNDLQARQIMARNAETCLMQQNVKKSKKQLSKNQSSTMPEDDVVFTSLILKMRNSRIS